MSLAGGLIGLTKALKLAGGFLSGKYLYIQFKQWSSMPIQTRKGFGNFRLSPKLIGT